MKDRFISGFKETVGKIIRVEAESYQSAIDKHLQRVQAADQRMGRALRNIGEHMSSEGINEVRDAEDGRVKARTEHVPQQRVLVVANRKRLLFPAK